MAYPVSTTMCFDFEFELQGSFTPGCPEQGPSYSSGGEPAEFPGIEDAEVTGLFVERVKLNRYGLPIYTNMKGGMTGAFTQKVYERVDVLAQVSPEARAEVLIALSDIFSHEAEATLLEDHLSRAV